MSTDSRRGAVFLHANQIEKTRMNNTKGGSVGKKPVRQKSFDNSRVNGKFTPSTKETQERKASVSHINKQYSVDNARRLIPQVAERRAKTTVPVQEENDALSSLPLQSSVTRANRRRTSISIRKGSTVGQDYNRGRRLSTARKCVTPLGTSLASQERRRSSLQHQPAPKKKAEDPSLTCKQIEAFREVFDLFDTNGGGSIDADELQAALASVEIHISHKEIEDVLSQIDDDGNGEIDFQEFLTLMTNTEKFLEMFASQHEQLPVEDSGREHVLFDALTQFMKKSALKQMDELVGPYAEPLHIFHSVKTTRHPVTKKAKPIDTEIPARTGKIRLIINRHRSPPKEEDEQEDEKTVTESTHSNTNLEKLDHRKISAAGELFTPRLGWVIPRAKSIAERLKFIKKKKAVLTTEDLPNIRKRIRDATKAYNKEMTEMKAHEAVKHWRKLEPHHIPSKLLQTHFQKVFCAYSSAVQYSYTCQPKEIPYKKV
ncbi:uncharacterized protein LOC117114435 [Anneissia japonica]|uniref:uncharacterized protein LOC117114435 n=1 Tax=Anneissia japonica TaxID=1529436 RepID=UPI00142557B8|nr:uncharacterized protein LOC117114435 [Anneissia japonica]